MGSWVSYESELSPPLSTPWSLSDDEILYQIRTHPNVHNLILKLQIQASEFSWYDDGTISNEDARLLYRKKLIDIWLLMFEDRPIPKKISEDKKPRRWSDEIIKYTQ